MSDETFDVIVIGAGPAGEVCAGRLAENGLAVAIVEDDLVGGECSFYACMPSKALLRPAQAIAEARRLPGAAQAVSGKLDVAAALKRRDEVVHDLEDDAQLPWLEDKGIALRRGRGVLTGRNEVRVGDDTLIARRAVVVATGSTASLPPIPGLAEAKPWTNRQATVSETVPARLAVLGGGVVGCELSQAYRSFGAEVTLLEPGPRVLAREEPFAGDQVDAALREAGVDLRLEVKAESVERDGDGGEVRLKLTDGSTVVADELLVAAGRTPNVAGLGLDAVGLDTDGKPLQTDTHLRVAGAEDWLYAIGDVNGRALLTHQGKYQARIAADAILGGMTPGLVYGGPLSPRVVFTEPQVAAVGHTLASAKEAGLDARAVDVDMNGTAGASFYGRNVPGTARIVVDENRGVLVGATFTGADVGEFVHAATIAIVGDVSIERLYHAVPSFPTRSEVWLNLLLEYGL